MPGRYAKDETSEGYIGAIEMYAYRMPIAPPEPVEGESEIEVSQSDSVDGGDDPRVVVSSNAGAAQ
jgi:hypothetical protein